MPDFMGLTITGYKATGITSRSSECQSLDSNPLGPTDILNKSATYVLAVRNDTSLLSSEAG